ncbi:MAG: hypothetical protein PPP58_10945 [Natronomonas sp.]
MSDDAYAFDEEIPIDPLPAGSVVMVAGAAFSPAEDLAQLLVTAGSERGDGMLFISTNMTAKKLLDDCRQLRPGLDADRVGIIDCSGQEIVQLDSPAQVKYISTQSDLTGIGMKFSSLYESIYEDVEDGQIRTNLNSLSSLAMYVDLRKLFKFTQTLSSRIDSADGLGVFVIDPTTHDEQTVSTLQQTVDALIEVQETDGDGDGELRIRGIRGQPDGWQPFSLPGGD